jgi:hypothetical protein
MSTESKSACCGDFTTCTRLDCPDSGPQRDAIELAERLRNLGDGHYLTDKAAAELERLAGVEKQLNTLAEWSEEKMAGLKTRVIQAESTTREMRRALDVVEERARVAEAELQTRPTATAAALLLDRAVQAESAIETAKTAAQDCGKENLRLVAKLAAHKRLVEKLRLEGNALADAVERHLQNPDVGFIDASTTQRFYDALALTAADCADKTEGQP